LRWQTCATRCSYWLKWVLQTFCSGWPWTATLLVLASQVAGIAGVTHQHVASFLILYSSKYVRRRVDHLARLNHSFPICKRWITELIL
jgi:hypothetical protein